MTDKLLEKYMVAAFNYVGKLVNKDGKVSKGLKTVAASFGPNVYTMGLFSTWELYKGKKGDYEKILKVLEDLYKEINPQLKDNIQDFGKYIEKNKDSKELRRHLLLASVAIKLTLRTYDDAEN